MIKKISKLKVVSIFISKSNKSLRKSETEIEIICQRNKPNTSSFAGCLIYGSGALVTTQKSSSNIEHISTGDRNAQNTHAHTHTHTHSKM